jgi:hypothetical protein
MYSLHILHVHLEVTTFYTNYFNEFLIYSERIGAHKHTDSCVLNGGESKKKVPVKKVAPTASGLKTLRTPKLYLGQTNP